MAPVNFSLEGRVALVTGGSRGIGKAIALGLAEAGASVAICSRHLAEAEKAAQEVRGRGVAALACRADVSVRSDVDALVAQAVQEFGGIDILVNNAGVGYRGELHKMSEAEFDSLLGTNFKSCFLTARAVVPGMVAKGKGSIINVSSVGSVRYMPGMAAYNITKAAVSALTRFLALELAPYGIRVNAIAPGPTQTSVLEAIARDPEQLKRVTATIPVGRLGKPEEMVGAAVYLASDAASFVTGHVLHVDGGRGAG